MTVPAPAPVLLGVNIDHVATLRQVRGTRYPAPAEAVRLAEQAGADSITLHLREDRRHIQTADLAAIAAVVRTHINLELAVTDEMLAIAERHAPRDCCLVPERREELTTEGGLDVAAQVGRIRDACARLGEAGIRVSLFIDPDKTQLDAALEAGAPVVELHTGGYAEASGAAQAAALRRIVAAAEYGHECELVVNAGHGLYYDNVQPVAAIPQIVELNIGHGIIARAVFVGIIEAVREMKQLLRAARS